MIEGMFGGFQDMLGLSNLALIFIGTALGLLVGALPGLSSPMAIIVLLPITFAMETLPAFALMIGIYVGTKLGGSFSAILLRTPGTPASACTAVDGYPMAQRGEAGLALGYATMSSTVGGVLGWAAAVVAIPTLATIALHSAPPDVALIGIAGLVMVSSFARGSMIKGFSGVLIGLLVASVGIDGQDAVMRYTFHMPVLESGIPFAAVLVGIFGFAVVFADVGLTVKGSSLVTKDVKLELPSFKDLMRRWRAWVIGSAYGVGIGAIPGVGADGSTWMAYATVKNQSKNPPPEAFGTGVPEGVIAPESSNNATTGGALVPMLTLGIPGDGSTAIMLGAMIMHGLTPGVSLMRDDPEIVYGLLAALLIATILCSSSPGALFAALSMCCSANARRCFHSFLCSPPSARFPAPMRCFRSMSQSSLALWAFGWKSGDFRLLRLCLAQFWDRSLNTMSGWVWPFPAAIGRHFWRLGRGLSLLVRLRF
ncbi:MAG: tripartite tricarboxylate transporter permease [Marinosulfonomonas sp.]|nr:tripartite tricarboxylate transporter permease [Marinosulfonomonas sp.]